MSIDEIEAAILKLGPRDRARLAEKLLESLEQLSPEENEMLWAQEAMRRNEEWDLGLATPRPSADVWRDANANLK